MPTGIIMQSSSHGATPEAIEKVLVENGYEVSKPEPEAPVEPKREDFQSQEEYAKAHDEFIAKHVPAEGAEPVEPKREDFKTDEEFSEAQEEFEAKQEEIEEERTKEAEKKRLEALPKLSRRQVARQKAIEKATKPLRGELEKLRGEIAELQGKKGPEAAATGEQPKIEAPKAPKREDFKSDDEFEEAKFQYRYQLERNKEQKELAKKQQEETQARLDAAMKKNFSDYKTSVLEFKKEHEDWDEVVNAEGVRIAEPVYYAIVDLGAEGPAVTYYLGQHPEELDRLAELTPYRAAIEVGRIADKLKKPAAGGERQETPKPKPKAIPEPVRPVSTSAISSTLTSREAARNHDFKAFKAAQRKGA